MPVFRKIASSFELGLVLILHSDFKKPKNVRENIMVFL
jgi:hypothetical protein